MLDIPVSFLQLFNSNALNCMFTAASSILITRPKNVTFTVGESVALMCSSSGNDPVNFEMKGSADNSQVKSIFTSGIIADAYQNQYRVIHENLFTFEILNASNLNAGSYVCTDKAGQGPDSATAEVTVSGKYVYNTSILEYRLLSNDFIYSNVR